MPKSHTVILFYLDLTFYLFGAYAGNCKKKYPSEVTVPFLSGTLPGPFVCRVCGSTPLGHQYGATFFRRSWYDPSNKLKGFIKFDESNSFWIILTRRPWQNIKHVSLWSSDKLTPVGTLLLELYKDSKRKNRGDVTCDSFTEWMYGSIGQFLRNSVLVDDVGASAHWKFEAILGEKSWTHFETQQFRDGRNILELWSNMVYRVLACVDCCWWTWVIC